MGQARAAAFAGVINVMMLGISLMAIWLIATGLLPLSKRRVPLSGTVLNVLAVVAGVLILLGR